ncbi:chromosome 19 open reading frame 47 [Nesidiocoris tenuis]|uniref:Chromosome 19 open reading frame 47 n=1 Tax=Nesidiocoris tenuis TaxID=355587 RepID=A0ABN7B9Q0_9HEMI|nr:chromosome 19 open reading frame 47 [Nesidiocoris tenuis]
MKSDCSAPSWLKFFMSAGIQKDSAETYAVTFSKNQIHLDMLPEIKKEYLVDMGITLMGHIIAILRHAKTVHTEEVTKSTLSTDKSNSHPSQKNAPVKSKPVSKTTPIMAKDNGAETTSSKTAADRIGPRLPPPPAKMPTLPPPEKRKEKPTPPPLSQVVQVQSNIAPVVSRPVVTRSAEPPVKRKLIERDESPVPDESEKKRRIFQRLGQATNSVNSNDAPSNTESVFHRLGQKTTSAGATEPIVISAPKKVTVKPIISQSKKTISRTDVSLMSNPKTKLLMLNQGVLTKTMRADQDIRSKILSSTSLSADHISQTIQNMRIGKNNIYSRLGKAAMDAEPSKPAKITTKTKRVSFGSVSEKTIPALPKRTSNGFLSPDKLLFAKTGAVFGPKIRRHTVPTGVFSRLGT